MQMKTITLLIISLMFFSFSNAFGDSTRARETYQYHNRQIAQNIELNRLEQTVRGARKRRLRQQTEQQRRRQTEHHRRQRQAAQMAEQRRQRQDAQRNRQRR